MIVLWFGSRNVFDEIISVGTLYIFSNYIRSFLLPNHSTIISDKMLRI